ncbi:MAG: ribose-5-phosphate isomerase RpiA [Thermoplasmata archaeon]|nr:ribose-5-phosphate isomerase RpiA [Thermoplasmata archaeon]
MADPHEAEKAAASQAAVARVRAGMRLALGTGSTADLAVRALHAKFPDGGGLTCVASSLRTEALARDLGISVGPLQPNDRFDAMIDGADEVDPALALTKGGGGALFREKFLARRAQQLLIVVDPSKIVERLGTRSRIPVEVVPYARGSLIAQLATRNLTATVRPALEGTGTFRTDNGLEILDLRPDRPLGDPGTLETELRGLQGVVETGLFVGLASVVFVGHADGTVDERRPAASH